MAPSIIHFNPAFLLLGDYSEKTKDKNAHLLLKKKKDDHYNIICRSENKKQTKKTHQMATNSGMINKLSYMYAV